MTRQELLEQVREAVDRHLDSLHSLARAGSVIIAIHCDNRGPQKVEVSTQESFRVNSQA